MQNFSWNQYLSVYTKSFAKHDLQTKLKRNLPVLRQRKYFGNRFHSFGWRSSIFFIDTEFVTVTEKNLGSVLSHCKDSWFFTSAITAAVFRAG